MVKLEWLDFGRKKAPKNSIVYPTLNFNLEVLDKHANIMNLSLEKSHT